MTGPLSDHLSFIVVPASTGDEVTRGCLGQNPSKLTGTPSSGLWTVGDICLQIFSCQPDGFIFLTPVEQQN